MHPFGLSSTGETPENCHLSALAGASAIGLKASRLYWKSWNMEAESESVATGKRKRHPARWRSQD
jgi:hypothetical protein